MSGPYTIEINSMVYDVYADVDVADLYMQAAFGSDTWFAQTETLKKQALVTATRILERTCWLGDRAAISGNPLDWPRLNTGIEGVEDDQIPDDITNAAIEMANLLVNGSDFQTNPVPGAQRLMLIKAGSVMLQYFRDAEGLFAKGARFPTVVQELLAPYLCGANSNLVGIATGTTAGGGQESVTEEDFTFNDGL